MQLKYRYERRLLATLETQEDREHFMVGVLLPIKCRLEAQYVQKRSLSFDLNILMKTVIVWPRRKLAYCANAWLDCLQRDEEDINGPIANLLIKIGEWCGNMRGRFKRANIRVLEHLVEQMQTGEEVIERLKNMPSQVEIERGMAKQ